MSDQEEAYFLQLVRQMAARGRRIDPTAVLAAIAYLEPRQQEAVRLCWMEGLRPTEAARRMGISQPRVSAILKQAQLKLRIFLTMNDKSNGF